MAKLKAKLMVEVEFIVDDPNPSQANSDIIGAFMEQIEANFEPIEGATLDTIMIQNLGQVNLNGNHLDEICKHCGHDKGTHRNTDHACSLLTNPKKAGLTQRWSQVFKFEPKD